MVMTDSQAHWRPDGLASIEPQRQCCLEAPLSLANAPGCQSRHEGRLRLAGFLAGDGGDCAAGLMHGAAWHSMLSAVLVAGV